MPVSALDGQVQEEQREGYDVATIHYTDGEGNERAIPLTETASGYADTLPEGVTEEQVMVEYFSTTRWDGAVDLSWYNGTDTEFTITTARQLAGVAALVNSNAADFAGKTIRLIFPPLTEEKRKDIVKDVSHMAEEAKIGRDAMEKLKAMKKDGELTEDDLKQAEKKTQELTDKYVKQADERSAAKQKEVLTL